MSKDSVMKFFETVRSDEAAVARLRALEGDTVAFARLSAELGRERGFAFEPSDVREALDALVRKAGGELSNQDLSAVAGGASGMACYAGGGGGVCVGSTGAIGPMIQTPLILKTH